MGGKFQLSRQIFEHGIWNNVSEFRLFVYLIGKAMHSEGVIVGDMRLKKGQYIRSYRKLREDLMYIENNTIKHYGLGTIKRLVDKLVADERITIQETGLGTVFTIVNYSNYQGFENINKDTKNTNGTPTEHQRNNNKNDKNVKEDIHAPIINYLNEKANKRYRATTKKTQSLISARIKEGFSIDDFKKVIDIKVSQWISNDEMNKYLRPETLFGNKFESYLNENISNKTKEQQYSFNTKASSKRL